MLVIPTVPGPPPHLQADVAALESFRGRAFSLLSIAGVSGFCQVTTTSIVFLVKPVKNRSDCPVFSLTGEHTIRVTRKSSGIGILGS